MKSKLFSCALAAAFLSASGAVAAPAHVAKKVKPPTTGPGCKPAVNVGLRGTVAASPGDSPVLPFALQLTVTAANKNGGAYIIAAQPVTVTVTTDTVVSRQGSDSLGSLLVNDKVRVRARACKADLAGGATPALTATYVIARATRTSGSGGSGGSSPPPPSF